jgi:hypothetical protein
MLDVLFTTVPYWNTSARNLDDDAGSNSPYKDTNRKQSGMPELEELLDRYSKVSGWDPRADSGGKDMEVGKVFHLIRVSQEQVAFQYRSLTFNRAQQSATASKQEPTPVKRVANSPGSISPASSSA